MEIVVLQDIDTPLDQEYREGKIGIVEYAARKRAEIEKLVREKFGLKRTDEDG